MALVAANAAFVANEFSLVAVDRTQVAVAAAAGDRRARSVQAATAQLSFHLSVAQLGITVSSVALGFIAQPTIARVLEGPLSRLVGGQRVDVVALGVALALATAVQMVVGELVPKAVALTRPLSTARALAPFDRITTVVFTPVVRLFSPVADRVVRLVGLEPVEELVAVRTRAELREIASESRRRGTLAEDEARIVERIFQFTDRHVAEVLTPRLDLVTIDRSASGADLAALARRTGLSRFPVVEGDPDHVVGVVHVKALLGVPPSDRDHIPVEDLMVSPLVISERRHADEVLLDMRRERQHLAVVIDEYGGTVGVVTLEDLLEDLVGEIHDEHDPLERVPRAGRGVVLVRGSAHADEVEEACGFRMPEGEYETLAGFLLARLGHIPTPGELVVVDGWEFLVTSMTRRRIDLVAVRSPRETSR